MGTSWFLGIGVQAVSCGAAPESSPRRQPWGVAWKGQSRGAAKELPALFLSPLPGLCLHCAISHGSRRGLLSDATPWLKACVLELWNCAPELRPAMPIRIHHIVTSGF